MKVLWNGQDDLATWDLVQPRDSHSNEVDEASEASGSLQESKDTSISTQERRKEEKYLFSGYIRGYKELRKALRKIKGIVSDEAVKLMKKHLSGTKLIFVTGETGSGKSSLLKEITGQELQVGHTLSSGTNEYGIWPTIIEGNHYIFIDTPGFGAADLHNNDILINIADCIHTFGSFLSIAGVLFLHDSMKDRLSSDEQKTIWWLHAFCGPSFFQSVSVITTKWDKINPCFIGQQRKLVGEYNSNYLKLLVDPPHAVEGASIYHHGIIRGGKCDHDWNVEPLQLKKDQLYRKNQIKTFIHEKYSFCSPNKLQIVEEFDRGTSLEDTQAAKALRADTSSAKLDITSTMILILSTENLDPADARLGVGCDQEQSQDYTYTENTWNWLRKLAKMFLCRFLGTSWFE